MKKYFRKEYILVFVAVCLIFRALVLNVFFPLEKTSSKSYSAKKDSGIKAEFKTAVSRFVPEDVAGLSFGYLLGEKSELPSGIEEKMKTVGLAHIIVVSGTHLSIIISASRKIFEKFSRFAALYFSVFLLILYVSLIGWSPSTIRASFVAILSILAWFFGREQRTVRTVILTLGFCLMINPYFLTNVSFQLSMLAYSGVVLILPGFIQFFYGREKPGFIGSVILSSLSAIIACLPIQMYYFGSLNLISLLANLLILPTIPYAMGFSFLTGVFSMIHLYFLAVGLGKISEIILKYHISVVSELEDKSEFLFEFQKSNPLWLLVYVPILILVFVAIHKNVKIGEGDAGDHDDTLVGLDEFEDVVSEVIERDEVRNAPSRKRNQKRREKRRFDDAKDAEDSALARAKIK